MTVDSLTFESAIFLTLLTILASLPTDPYFQRWYEDFPSYRMPPTHRRSDTPFEGPYFYRTPRTPPERSGYRPNLRSNLPIPGTEDRPGGMSLPGEVYQGQDAYSSHVNSEENQKPGEKTPKNIRENVGRLFGFENQEGMRNVTPKRRRPLQGRPSKNGSRPCTTNTITTTEKPSNGTKKTSRRPQGGEIVFPDTYYKKFVPRLGKCPKKSTFCEQLGEEYPSEHISQVLRTEGAMFREFFGKDVISEPDITERMNAPEENLCSYRQEVVFPRAAQNKENKWLFIVNQDQYVQGVTVEVCLRPEESCMLTEGFPLGYTPYCKQKYIERRLVAIGEDGKPHSDSFKLPSCCSCVVKHEATARIGDSIKGRRAAGQN